MTNHIFDRVKIKFEKFLSLIGNVLNCEKEVHTIQNKLRRHFNTTISDYLCSNEFLSSLDQILNKFSENNKLTKYYTLLASFDEQLRKHSIKSPKSTPSSTARSNSSSSVTTTQELLPPNEILSSNPIASTIEYDTSISDVQQTIENLLDRCCEILSETIVNDKVQELPSESKRQRRIVRLERRLARLAKIIRELEEKDMSLDEMAHCDLYEVESNLKRQACQIHERLAELKRQSSTADRILYQPITLNESEIGGHSLINKELQDMVNQSKNFPSFNDVLEIVEKTNKKYQLNLNEEAREKLAEKSFKIIGKEIKNRRMADFQDIMFSRLPEDFNIEQNDPALNNEEIEQVLAENQREAVIKTEKIFEEYSRFDPGPEEEINVESSEDEHEITMDSQPMEYEGVDVLPPLSADPLTPVASESNSNEAKAEISLNDRTLTILSTASLPVKRSISNHDTNISNSFQSSSTMPKEQHVQTLIPRHKQNLNDNEIIYQLYKQRLTNNKTSDNNKRRRSITNQYTNVKKTKQQQQPEVIVLD